METIAETAAKYYISDKLNHIVSIQAFKKYPLRYPPECYHIATEEELRMYAIKHTREYIP